MKKNSSDSLFFLLLILLGITTALTAAGFFYSRDGGSVPSFAPGAARLCVVLDAGHGSPDGGAVGPGGTQEKDVNLAIVMKLREVFEGRGAKVIPVSYTHLLRVIPSCVIGSALAGALSAAFGCTLMAPHGGIFVFPVVDHPLLYLVALAAGTVATAVILGLVKMCIRDRRCICRLGRLLRR